MSQINPFAHVVFQSIEVQRRGAVEKERQLKREAVMEKDMAAHEDALEHQVESAEEVSPVGEEAEHEKQRRKRQAMGIGEQAGEGQNENPHIDLTA